MGNLPDYALYYVKDDKVQSVNRAAEYPDKLEEMRLQFFYLIDGYYRAVVEEVPLQ